MIALKVLVAMLATLAFSILFGAPRRQWLFCSVTGGVGWLVYSLLLACGVGMVVATLFASLALTVISRVFSVARKTPITVFLIAGIFPLVPGAGIYYTAYYLFASDYALGLSKGVETFKLAGAIALGILFGSSLPSRLFRWARGK